MPDVLLCVMCDRECNEKLPHIVFVVHHGDDPKIHKAVCYPCLAQFGLRISRWKHDGTWDKVLLGAGLHRKKIVAPNYNPLTGEVM